MTAAEERKREQSNFTGLYSIVYKENKYDTPDKHIVLLQGTDQVVLQDHLIDLFELSYKDTTLRLVTKNSYLDAGLIFFDHYDVTKDHKYTDYGVTFEETLMLLDVTL
ncbi:MAG: hypothetical protein JHC33_03370 [Ignisphaera sp.]|nr:hypothetical protein [Ignisphaera sp.]